MFNLKRATKPDPVLPDELLQGETLIESTPSITPYLPSLEDGLAEALDVIQNDRPVTIIERYDAIYVESLEVLRKSEGTLADKIERDTEELRQVRVAIAAAEAAHNTLNAERPDTVRPEPRRSRATPKAIAA